MTEISKVRRAFDVSTPAQEAALASLADGEESRRRRAAERRRAARSWSGSSATHGLDPVAGAVGNFVFVELGEDSRPFQERLLREGRDRAADRTASAHRRRSA